MIPYCLATGVGLIPVSERTKASTTINAESQKWSPNARGVLARPRTSVATQSVRSNHDPTLTRLVSPDDIGNNIIVDTVEEIAKSRGLSMAVISTAWALKKGVNPIVGLNSKERIDEAVVAANVDLTDEEVNKLEAAYVPKRVMGY
jgi:aryl-alcohol dehydrogenase-like predicted oxidoreductase